MVFVVVSSNEWNTKQVAHSMFIEYIPYIIPSISEVLLVIQIPIHVCVCRNMNVVFVPDLIVSVT